MDTTLRDSFLSRWRKYFRSAELPITFEYVNDPRGTEIAKSSVEIPCFIAALAEVRAGKSLAFNADSFGCMGGKHYCGYSARLREGIFEFLSHDERGEGERYKKTPRIAAEVIARAPRFDAPARFLLCKRWDKLTDADDPQVVVFFAAPDVLSGLFTLAGYDEPDPQGAVMIPFAAGCGTIVRYPFVEFKSENPRAVVGMFDVSARPHVPSGTLTFAVPLPRFQRMVANMDESFLITGSWALVRERIGSAG
jgi:uncharacterized protein (DUF169 family)